MYRNIIIAPKRGYTTDQAGDQSCKKLRFTFTNTFTKLLARKSCQSTCRGFVEKRYFHYNEKIVTIKSFNENYFRSLILLSVEIIWLTILWICSKNMLLIWKKLSTKEHLNWTKKENEQIVYWTKCYQSKMRFIHLKNMFSFSDGFRTVADALKAGNQVHPESFECSTVFFSDIVGFRDICSKSTPLEAVSMLNNLYAQFDEIILQFDAYKVKSCRCKY